MFSEIPGIHVMPDRNITTGIDSRVHQCIIIENQTTQDYSQLTEQATFPFQVSPITPSTDVLSLQR